MDLSTLSTKDLVNHFNALVVASHPTVACITIWKASKADLIAKIKALPKVPVTATRDEILAESNKAFAAQAKVEAEAVASGKVNKAGAKAMADSLKASVKGKKPAKGKAPAKEKTARKGQSDAEVSAYFTANDLNPKIVRAKLRRSGLKAPYTLAQIKALIEKA
jgi:hypothetical protein